MLNGHNQATRMVKVIDDLVAQRQKSGANIEQTYGQVFGLSADGLEASVYLAGSRELATADGGVPEPSDGFRVPAWMKLAASDYVRVAIDARGHRWVEEYLPSSPYSKVSIDFVNGRIAFGSGTAAPTNYLTVTAGDLHVSGLNVNNGALDIDEDGVIWFGPGVGDPPDSSIARSDVGQITVDGALTVTGNMFAPNKARWVPVETTPVNASRTSSLGSTNVEVTGVPATGVVAVTGYARIRSSTTGGDTINISSFSGELAGYAMATGVANRDGTTHFIAATGGTNNRQINYSVSWSSGTVTYVIQITGYWTTE